MATSKIIQVGMGEFQVAQNGVLKTTGLGSCIGLILYDPIEKAAGLAHIMLPDSDISREHPIQHAKYADTAVPLLINSLLKLGAKKKQLIAKMAGGAQMFSFDRSSDVIRIGVRNAEACKRELANHGIPLVGEDVGGNYGRTIEFDLITGSLFIRSVNQVKKEI